jgi:hypothetical protein
MSAVERVNHRAAWTARTLVQDAAAWTYVLSEEDVAELDTAIRQAPEAGENQIVSALSVFSRLVDTHPGVARHLLDCVCRKAVTSMATGCMAALDAEADLARKR